MPRLLLARALNAAALALVRDLNGGVHVDGARAVPAGRGSPPRL